MELREALLMALLFLVFGTLAVGVTARLAIRPIVDAIVRLREAPHARRLADVESEVGSLRRTVTRLADEAAFERELRNLAPELTETQDADVPGSTLVYGTSAAPAVAWGRGRIRGSSPWT